VTTRAIGRSRLETQVRALLIIGYVAFVAFGLTATWQPRVFWTMLLPLVPVGIVLMGFATWREVCPLAAFGDLGRWLNRGEQRRVPGWLERWFFVVTFCILLLALVFRLVATNGDGVWLAGLLVGLALAALVTNWIFTGKSWCNFICPVGLVERIYTEPNSLVRSGANSQCVRCTACKKYCPDIDQENGYWRDMASTGRQFATYAFPGLVLAFYTYYYLRYGAWAAYFDGRWTLGAANRELVLGSGFFFAPDVPAVAAATGTMVVFSAASLGLFLLIERVVGRFEEDAERRRHLVLALAAFVAFSVFYIFAGAPTLRRLTGGTRLAAFVAPLVATLFLVKRWQRRREHYIRERSASKLLRNWPFDQPPPEDPSEVYAWIKAGEHAQEQHTAAYENTVREMIADGLVHGGEMRLLDEVRKQLGISTREHEKIIARLSEEERDLFTQDGAGSEQRAQLEGYETALAEALFRHAPEREIADLRQAFGVSLEDHQTLIASMRGESGTLQNRARGQLARARSLHADIATLGTESSGPQSLLAYLLQSEQDAAVNRVIEFLEIAGETDRIAPFRLCLFHEEDLSRKAALRHLQRACPEHADLIRQLEPLIVEREMPGDQIGSEAVTAAVVRHLESPDVHIRAAALWAHANESGTAAGPQVALSLTDPQDLVRETAVRSARHLLELAEAELEGQEGNGALSMLSDAMAPGREEEFEHLSVIEKMQYLHRVPLFAELDPEDLHDLSLLTEERSLEPAEPLCVEGDAKADDLFVLIEGEVSVTLRAADGSSEVELGVMTPGEVIGELSPLDGSPRSATVRPKGGPIRVLRIPGVSFRTRLMQRPRVARSLLTGMAQRIRRLSFQAARSGSDS